MPGFSTRAIRSQLPAREAAASSEPTAQPIFQTASFSFDTTDNLARGVSEPGFAYSYSRLANPNTESLAAAVADLEGAAAGVVLASGMAALHAAVLATCKAGDRIVASRLLYGNTIALARSVLPRCGIEVSFVDTGDQRALQSALDKPTRLVICETVSNPTLAVTDIAGVAETTHAAGADLLVDNTFATPYLTRPLERGADLVVHSATKYLGGHGDLIAGVVVGAKARIEAIWHLSVDVGGVAAPFVAWLCARGIRTLALRMERHCESARAVALHLEGHPKVATTLYPWLDSHPSHTLARETLRAGGGMVSAILERGDEGARRFLDRLALFHRAGSLGDIHSLAVHPATTSHRQLSTSERLEAGLPDGFVRLSIGLEDVEDLIADLDQALEVV